MGYFKIVYINVHYNEETVLSLLFAIYQDVIPHLISGHLRLMVHGWLDVRKPMSKDFPSTPSTKSSDLAYNENMYIIDYGLYWVDRCTMSPAQPYLYYIFKPLVVYVWFCL
jgi:hypothetical protein